MPAGMVHTHHTQHTIYTHSIYTVPHYTYSMHLHIIHTYIIHACTPPYTHTLTHFPTLKMNAQVCEATWVSISITFAPAALDRSSPCPTPARTLIPRVHQRASFRTQTKSSLPLLRTLCGSRLQRQIQTSPSCEKAHTPASLPSSCTRPQPHHLPSVIFMCLGQD